MQLDFLSYFWVILIVISLLPMLKQRKVNTSRIALIQSLENERNSRVISLIHRQESISFLGIPVRKFIDLEDSEQILRAVRLTPDNMPIDLILHTPGGLVLAAEQIARALKRHPAKVTVIIPHYAMSGGTLIALAADEIILDENAVLGPIDPQIGQFPASSILRVLREKSIEDVDDQTIMWADIAEKAIRQVHDTAVEILKSRISADQAQELATILSDGRWTHDHALICSTLTELGLPVSCKLPNTVHKLMELYPQPSRHSVEYVPVPYRKDIKPR